MEFHSGLNLLLEALAYLGRRAGGFTTERMLERLRERGVEDVSPIEASLCPIARLTGKLDRVLDPDPERLQYLFGNLPGFPYNTIGSYSRGFLLLYGVISRFRGSCAEVLDQAVSRTAAQLAGDLSMELDLGEEPELTGEELSLRVLSMNVPAESKVAVLELYHSGPALLGEVMGMVQAVVEAMEREKAAMEVCCAPFARLVRELGPGAVLAKTSSLNTDPDRSDIVRPFLYGMDTLLAVTPSVPGPNQVYCGILRLPLQEALASARGPEVEVCEAIRLLADQTRFDILCHLRDRVAYGQELAVRFGLSRNTLHHHMTKLLAAHLVKCTVDGNRVYYRVDEETVGRLLDRLRKLLMTQ